MTPTEISVNDPLVSPTEISVGDPLVSPSEISVNDTNGNFPRASRGSSKVKFATEEANLTPTQKIYALMQCTPDISERNCSYCLRETVGYYRSCCYGKQGGYVNKPSCIFRWELYPFYNSIADAPTLSPSPPPPPPLSIFPPPANNTTTKDNGATAARTVVIITVPTSFFAALVGLACSFFYYRSCKKKTESKLSSLFYVINLGLCLI
ncbi:putative cysteine-rich receptor-like protein kinase 35 [Manihot esculenta]|uniref:putative cysteine-rich receptor-like protein kinase 35 n=1 Tax=Manihot esculenta TaxID=3983 RepID=UPI001CC5EE0C|nr:putative cysteine-rich receptor-like protein kinase 35 [Manihot esculenta]